MSNYGSRTSLWREYYKAVRVGNKALAEKILTILHSPPQQSQVNPTAGVPCRKCRGRLQ